MVVQEMSIGELEQIVHESPNNADAWALLAEKYFGGFKYGQAISAATHAILLGKDSAEIRLLRVQCFRFGETPEHDRDNILTDLKKAVEFDPTNKEYLHELAGVYCTKGDLDSALELYNQLLMLEPTDVWALEMRSGIYCDKGNFIAAMKDAQKCLQLPGEHQGLSYVNLARICLQMNNNTDAKLALNEALKRNNPCAPANEALICIYLDEENYPEAIKHCNVLLELENQAIRDYGEQNRKPDNYYLRALAYAGMSDKTNAKKDFETCLKIQQGYLDAEQRLRALNYNDLLQDIEDKLQPPVKEKLNDARELLNSSGDDKTKLRRVLTISDEAIALSGGSLSAAHMLKAYAYDGLKEHDYPIKSYLVKGRAETQATRVLANSCEGQKRRLKR